MDESNIFSKFCWILWKPIDEIVVLPRFAESNAIFMTIKIITLINFTFLVKKFRWKITLNTKHEFDFFRFN